MSDIIENPLDWQVNHEKQTLPLNMFGFHRFWATVQHLSGLTVYTNGSPEFNEIVIPLNGEIGLKLFTEEIDKNYTDWESFEDDETIPIWIEFGFVKLSDYGDKWQATEFHGGVFRQLEEVFQPPQFQIKPAGDSD